MSLLLPEPLSPNPIFAEISAYNWPQALYSEICNVHGHDYASWKASLETFYSTENYNLPKNIELKSIFQKIFHAICLSSSIRKKYDNGYYNNVDVVGTISDFYYSIYNAAISLSMQRNFTENDTHGKNISIFTSNRKYFPYPFNIYTEFDPQSWNGNISISKNNFNLILPHHSRVMNSPTNPAINRRQPLGVLTTTIAQDILLGYLRGTIEYYIDKETEKLKKHNKTINLRTVVGRQRLNSDLIKTQISFMNCLYRYRTKAHYRDFLYLTYKYSDEYSSNDYMDIHFYNYLSKVSEFLICASIVHAGMRVGNRNVSTYLIDISSQIKTEDSLKFWNIFI